MLATNIESEIRKILEGSKGNWLRVSDCAKQFAKGNKSKETKFYRWRKQVENAQVSGFQVVKLPNNISFIGLSSADSKILESIISEDNNLAESGNSGFGFWKWLDRRAERKKLDEEEIRLEACREMELLAKEFPSFEALKELAEKTRKEIEASRKQRKLGLKE